MPPSLPHLPPFLLVPELRQSLQAEDEDGEDDNHDADDGDDPGPTRRLGVLEQHPDLLLPLCCRQGSGLLFGKALVRLEAVDDFLAELVEVQFLQEHVQRDVGGPPQPPARLVEVENGVEADAVPVQEQLVAQRVVVAEAPPGVTQQRVGELSEGTELGFVAHPRDVDGQAFTQGAAAPTGATALPPALTPHLLLAALLLQLVVLVFALLLLITNLLCFLLPFCCPSFSRSIRASLILIVHFLALGCVSLTY